MSQPRSTMPLNRSVNTGVGQVDGCSSVAEAVAKVRWGCLSAGPS